MRGQNRSDALIHRGAEKFIAGLKTATAVYFVRITTGEIITMTREEYDRRPLFGPGALRGVRTFLDKAEAETQSAVIKARAAK